VAISSEEVASLQVFPRPERTSVSRKRHAQSLRRLSSIMMASRRVLLVGAAGDIDAEYRPDLEAAGWQVNVATSASSCIATVRKQPPDVIVMDGHLPDGNGWTLTSVLKGWATTARTPIIALVAISNRNGEVERARAAGCDAFLLKPCTAEELVAQIETSLRRPPTA
jgi:two-component system, cell cycle response regulator DivK